MAVAKLSRLQERLLRYPPTKTTWICESTILADEAQLKCGVVNNGAHGRCWLCHTVRPLKPRLLWSDYEKACKAAGIEPGTRWPETPKTPRKESNVRRSR